MEKKKEGQEKKKGEGEGRQRSRRGGREEARARYVDIGLEMVYMY